MAATGILSSQSLGGRPDPRRPDETLPMRVEMSGTSMAAPHVAGIVALLLEGEPTLTAHQVSRILVAAADPPAGIDPRAAAWGFGRVDAERAVERGEA